MIEIEGLPEGWKPLKVKISCNISNVRSVMQCAARVDLERIKPREITLVETDEFRKPLQGEYFRRGMVDSPIEVCSTHDCDYAVKIWRIRENS